MTLIARKVAEMEKKNKKKGCVMRKKKLREKKF